MTTQPPAVPDKIPNWFDEMLIRVYPFASELSKKMAWSRYLDSPDAQRLASLEAKCGEQEEALKRCKWSARVADSEKHRADEVTIERDQLRQQLTKAEREVFDLRQITSTHEGVRKLIEERDQLRSQLTAQNAAVAKMRETLRVAKCPFCDGSGGIQISADEAEQCQWCFERDALIASSPATVASDEREDSVLRSALDRLNQENLENFSSHWCNGFAHAKTIVENMMRTHQQKEVK